MIRVGRTRNLLRASSSLSEIWPRSAHLHLGQRHLSGRTNRPDKSPHSITCLRFRNSLQMRAASTREGWTAVPCPPPLARAKAFSRSGCGRIFPLFSRVMWEGLSTAAGARRPERGLSGAIFSGPVDCLDLVFFLQYTEMVDISFEHLHKFDLGSLSFSWNHGRTTAWGPRG